MYLAYDICMAREAQCVFVLRMDHRAFLETMGGGESHIGRNPLVSTDFQLAILNTARSCSLVSATVGSVCCGIWKGNQGCQLIVRLKMTSHLKIQKSDSNPERNQCSFELSCCYFIPNFKPFLLNMEKSPFPPGLLLSILLLLGLVLKCSQFKRQRAWVVLVMLIQ